MSEFETEKLFHELESLRLIDRKRGTFTPHKWNERQYKSDVSTDRVKEFRKRKRNVSLVLQETPPEQIQNRADTEQNRTEGNREVKRASRSKPKTEPPDGWAHLVTPALELWAETEKFTREEIDHEIPMMLDHFRAKGEMRSDWAATARNWMRNSRKFTRGNSNGNSNHTGKTAAQSGGLAPRPYIPKERV